MKTIIHRNHQISVRPSADANGFPQFIAANYCLAAFVVAERRTENEALEAAKEKLNKLLDAPAQA